MTLLKDRSRKRSVTHRIACGRPGNPQASGKERYFSSLDHFEITGVEQARGTDQFTVDTEAMKRLVAFDDGVRYKDRRRVPVRLDSNNIEDFLKQEYESRASLPVLGADGTQKMWTQKNQDTGRDELVPAKMVQVWCHGDGQTAKRRQKDGKEKPIRCCADKRNLVERTPDELAQLLSRRVAHLPEDGKLCPWMQNDNAKAAPQCKPTTLLVCRSDVVNNLGSFCKFRSSGHNTADELFTSLDDIKRQLGNYLEDVPLDLVLVMKNIRHGGTGRPQPIVHVELRADLDATYRYVNERLKNKQAMLQAASTKALLPEAMKAAGELEDEEFSRVVADHQKPGGALGAVVDGELVEKDKS